MIVGKEPSVAFQESFGAALPSDADTHLHRIQTNLAPVDNDHPIQVLFVLHVPRRKRPERGCQGCVQILIPVFHVQ